MRVLMFSLDRGLLGDGSSGDVIERHRKYANLAGALDIIVFAPPSYDAKIYADNFRVFPTKSSKLSHFRKAVKLAEKLAEENHYDLIVSQDMAAPAAAVIKKKFNLPWIVNIHSMFFSPEWLGLNPGKWYLLFKIKRVLNLVDGFRVNNEKIKEKLLDWGIGKPILIQPTPVDIEKFIHIRNLSRLPATLPSPGEGRVCVLYVGRLSPEKNVALLIRAVIQLPTSNFQLLIVGSGPEEQKLESLAAQDARIKFLGAKSQSELAEIYQNADILVLPSNTESFGKVLIEAAASGCALIATRTPGASSIIEDNKSGLLVDVGDEQGLKMAIEKLITDNGLRKRLGEAAREMAKKYDAGVGIKKTVEFWKKIARNLSPTLSDIGEGERVR